MELRSDNYFFEIPNIQIAMFIAGRYNLVNEGITWICEILNSFDGTWKDFYNRGLVLANGNPKLLECLDDLCSKTSPVDKKEFNDINLVLN